MPDRAGLSVGARRRLRGAGARLSGRRGRAGQPRSWRASTAPSCSGRPPTARTVPTVQVERFIGLWPGDTPRALGGGGEPHQHLLEDPAARRDRGRGRRWAARAEPGPARGPPELHRHGRLHQIAGDYTLASGWASARGRRRLRWPARRRWTAGSGGWGRRCRAARAGGSTGRRWSFSTRPGRPVALFQAVYLY